MYILGRYNKENNDYKLFWSVPVNSMIEAMEYTQMYAFENRGEKFIVVDAEDEACDIVYSYQVN